VRRRRHIRIVIPIIAFLVAALGTAALLYWQKPEPPFAAVEHAERAIQKARTAGALDYCPETLQTAEDSVKAAWKHIREQNRRIYFLRDFALVARAAENARLTAVRAETTAVAIQDSLRAESETTIGMAELAVEQVRVQLARVQPSRANRSSLSTLEVGLVEVRHLHRKAAYRESLERARFLADRASRLEETAAASLVRYAADRGRWNRWVQETIRWSRENGAAAVVVQKIDHAVELYQGGKLIRKYRADLGSAWMGQKIHMGDNATPEGRYRITNKKGHGSTKYHKALLLNYPNDEDRRRFASAKRNGELTRRASIGGLIEIHGHGGRGEDWTQGCVALDNGDMDHLFSRVGIGTPVTIVGTAGEVD
jgi:hypothetical protein